MACLSPKDDAQAESKDQAESKEQSTSTDYSKLNPFNVIMIGGSGSVGQALVNRLIQANKCQNIHLLNRKEIPAFSKQEKVNQYIVDMSQLESETNKILSNIDKENKPLPNVAYITMGCGAPSKVDEATLEKVDVTLPTQFAKAVKENNISHIALLSSVAADINKKKNWLGTSAGGGLYLHLKGQIEQNLSTMGFKSVGLFRPSTLYGSPNTPGSVETLQPFIEWAIPKKYNGIQITDLAGAMLEHTKDCLSKYDDMKENRVDILEGEKLFNYIPKDPKADTKK